MPDVSFPGILLGSAMHHLFLNPQKKKKNKTRFHDQSEEILNESKEIQKTFYENSFNNELFSRSPYKLTLDVEELISHPPNIRVAKRHRKNPQSASPPRPLNKFFLFRRDFIAKQKQSGRKMKLADISCLAKNVWKNLPKEAVRCFEVLEQLAKDRHKEIYKGFKYKPKKINVKNSNPKKTRRNNEKNSNSKNTVEITKKIQNQRIHVEKLNDPQKTMKKRLK
ncbi:hypothetical protein C2G38_2031894 [Gigaspora rosea]|uniref:HMG box domain-containing protein n=1 Tax=Gigaspora rosea TaxID=44941 RepID=A0A397VTW4_9GLOM|nr:hypothetical protein C2G38_2031894 [Gigaspora rosea]